MRNPLVHILVLNFNCLEKISACVASLEKLTYPNFRILLLDNGSVDGSDRELPRRFPAHELVLNGRNLGYAAGINVGARLALERGADLIWMLNPDTLVEPGALSALVEVHASLRKPGLIGSLILNDDSDRIYFYKGVITAEGKVRHAHAGESQSQIPELARAAVGETDFVNGASTLFSRQVAEEVGLMPEDYFLYYEDVDWSLRVAAQGFANRVAYRSLVHHMRTGGPPVNYVGVYYTRRNEFFFRQRHGFPVSRNVTLGRLRIRMAKHAVRMLLGRRTDHHQNMYYVIGRVARAIKEGRMGYEPLQLPRPPE
jgi:hypothetical protein